VKEKVKEKQKPYAALSNFTSDEEKGGMEAVYNAAKKVAKKAVTTAKNNTYEKLYQKLESKDGEKMCLS